MPLKILKLFIFAVAFVSLSSCTGGGSTSTASLNLTLEMSRVSTGTFNPFDVTVTATRNGVAQQGLTLDLTIPKGSVSAVVDNADGTYTFRITPTATGVYPVTVASEGATVTRKAVVLDEYATGVGQPMAVPGDFVNTVGYEDGITITPDGSYLFLQYGPFNFSGIFSLSTVCSSGSYSIGYDLNSCDGRTNSGLVFNTIGPKNDSLRPGFGTASLNGSKLRFLPGFVIGGTANGLAAFPTLFYGFKRQTDGTFAEPFTLAFNDPKRVNGPFGLSFKMNSNGTGTFIVAWNNLLNDLGDDGADIYTGTINFGTNTSLGTVAYGASFGGDSVASITPNISPVGFTSHAGTQGNPHLYSDGGGVIRSIWTDDESGSQDLTVFRLTAGTFPNGTWAKETLPSVINTSGEEDQPFFTGTRLIFSRGSKIVSHTYTPTNGACASGFTSNDCWGPEIVLVGGIGTSTAGTINGVGEPTIAVYGGKTYLYFVFVEARAVQSYAGLVDFNLDAGFVEIP